MSDEDITAEREEARITQLSSSIVHDDDESASREAPTHDGYPNPAGGLFGILYPYRKYVLVAGAIAVAVVAFLEVVSNR